MNISKEFADVLEAMCAIANPAGKSTSGQSDCLVFDGTKVGVFNGFAAMLATLPDDWQGVIGAVVADKLEKALKIASRNAEVEYEEGKLRIHNDNTRITLTMAEVSGFPMEQLEKLWGGDFAAVDAEASVGLSACALSMNPEHFRPEFQGYCLVEDRILSTDGARVTEYKVGRAVFPEEPGVIMSGHFNDAKAAMQLGITGVQIEEGWVKWEVRNGVAVLLVSQVAGLFPNPDAAFARADGGTEVLLPEGLAEAVKNAEGFTDVEYRSEMAIKLDFRPGCVKVSGEGPTGRLHCSLEMDYDGDPMSILLHPSYLRDANGLTSKMVFNKDVCLFHGDKFRHLIGVAQAASED